MKLPFVSRAHFDEVNNERKKLLDIILKHQLGETLYYNDKESYVPPQVTAEIQPEQFNKAREEVQEQAKATYQAFIARRPSAIVADQTRRAEQAYRKKYMPNQNTAVAMFEAAEQEVKAQA